MRGCRGRGRGGSVTHLAWLGSLSWSWQRPRVGGITKYPGWWLFSTVGSAKDSSPGGSWFCPPRKQMHWQLPFFHQFRIYNVTYLGYSLRVVASTLKSGASYSARVKAWAQSYNSTWSEWSPSTKWLNCEYPTRSSGQLASLSVSLFFGGFCECVWAGLFIYLFFGLASRLAGSQFPHEGPVIEPGSLYWKPGTLTTRQPGNSQQLASLLLTFILWPLTPAQYLVSIS